MHYSFLSGEVVSAFTSQRPGKAEIFLGRFHHVVIAERSAALLVFSLSLYQILPLVGTSSVLKWHKNFVSHIVNLGTHECVCWFRSYSIAWHWKILTLQWRHNERDGILNHQPHDCLLNRLFRHKWNKTSKLRVTGLCAGNSPVTSGFWTI